MTVFIQSILLFNCWISWFGGHVRLLRKTKFRECK